MALIGAVYKWRLDCDSYVYITDTNGAEPLIITAKCLEEKSEQSIKNIVTTWDERTYCERFNEMVNYVHSFEKWKDLHFLDCNVYLKEYYGCEEMLKPSFPTGIELNLSADSISYREEPQANIVDVKCITRDGEKITSYDINFGIPKGIPGLNIIGTISDIIELEQIIETKPNINDAYILEPIYDDSGLEENQKKGALYVYKEEEQEYNGVINTIGFFEYITNLRGPQGIAGEEQYRYDAQKKSYMFGSGDIASGLYSFSKGGLTVASGAMSTADGYKTKSIGDYSHAEGANSEATGHQSHAEGNGSKAIGQNSHAEGTRTVANNNQSHAEGYETKSMANGAHAEGDSTIAYGKYSHAEGANSVAGYDSDIPVVNDLEIPNNSDDYGGYAHAEGSATLAIGKAAHSEGNKTFASNDYSHAEGSSTTASGMASHAEGSSTTASGMASHAEGDSTTAQEIGSHAEGVYTKASGMASHAEGGGTTAQGVGSHSEGTETTAVGEASHAEGNYTTANGNYSHTEGYATITNSEAEHAEGKYNKSNTNTISSIGIGTSETNRKNAFEVMNTGDVYIKDIGNYNGVLGENSKSLQQYLLEQKIKVVKVFELSEQNMSEDPKTWQDADLYHYCDTPATNTFFTEKDLNSTNYIGLKPNTFYRWVNSINSGRFHISFDSYDVNEYSEYMAEFNVGIDGISLSFGQINNKNIVFTENSDLETIHGKTYQLSVLNNIGILINA